MPARSTVVGVVWAGGAEDVVGVGTAEVDSTVEKLDDGPAVVEVCNVEFALLLVHPGAWRFRIVLRLTLRLRLPPPFSAFAM